MQKPLQDLLDTLPQIGRIDWIAVRPERKAPMLVCDSVQLQAGRGIVGDRYNGKSGKRQVTLIQSEHLLAIAGFLARETLDPAILRRNIAVSGINLLALKGQQFYLGEALLEFTGLCHPCSAMEAALGAGGYNAVRGHGGITARIVQGGIIYVGDKMRVLTSPHR